VEVRVLKKFLHPQGTTVPESAMVDHDESQPPALSLHNELYERQSGLVSFPGPASLPSSDATRHFEPLEVIRAGRDRDRAALVCNHASDHLSLIPAEEAFFDEFLCFRLGEEEYGINILEIKEIIKPRVLTEVPRAAAFIDGIISLRGVIVPVLNVRKRLSMTLEYDRSLERIIIVRCGEGVYGLRVDRITEVLKIAKKMQEPAPDVLDGFARECVAGIGRPANRLVIMLDVCKIVDITLGEAL
jgi:purine-binding chemotaxis protein CheW